MNTPEYVYIGVTIRRENTKPATLKSADENSARRHSVLSNSQENILSLLVFSVSGNNKGKLKKKRHIFLKQNQGQVKWVLGEINFVLLTDNGNEIAEYKCVLCS